MIPNQNRNKITGFIIIMLCADVDDGLPLTSRINATANDIKVSWSYHKKGEIGRRTSNRALSHFFTKTNEKYLNFIHFILRHLSPH